MGPSVFPEMFMGLVATRPVWPTVTPVVRYSVPGRFIGACAKANVAGSVKASATAIVVSFMGFSLRLDKAKTGEARLDYSIKYFVSPIGGRQVIHGSQSRDAQTIVFIACWASCWLRHYRGAAQMLRRLPRTSQVTLWQSEPALPRAALIQGCLFDSSSELGPFPRCNSMQIINAQIGGLFGVVGVLLAPIAGKVAGRRALHRHRSRKHHRDARSCRRAGEAVDPIARGRSDRHARCRGEGICGAPARVGPTNSSSDILAISTKWTPSWKCSAERRPSSRAILVFPTPPAPVMVTRRLLSKSRSISRWSGARPSKEVKGRGRLDGVNRFTSDVPALERGVFCFSATSR